MFGREILISLSKTVMVLAESDDPATTACQQIPHPGQPVYPHTTAQVVVAAVVVVIIVDVNDAVVYVGVLAFS